MSKHFEARYDFENKKWDIYSRVDNELLTTRESETEAFALMKLLDVAHAIGARKTMPKPNEGLINYKDGRREYTENVSKRAKEIIGERLQLKATVVAKHVRTVFNDDTKTADYIFRGVRVSTSPKNYEAVARRAEQLRKNSEKRRAEAQRQEEELLKRLTAAAI